MNCDLLLKNGRLFNPKRSVDRIADLAVVNGKLHFSDEPLAAASTIDVNNCLVVPGLIDIHTHLNYQGAASGMPADLPNIPFGVTASLDAGSAGVANVRSLAKRLAISEIKSKFMLNVSASGIIMANQFPESVDPSDWDIGLFDEVFAEYKDRIPALKIRISKNVVGDLGLEPLKKTLNLAERYGVRVCVHTTNPPCSMSEVAMTLRPGDILTHMYHGSGRTCLEDGKVAEGFWEARKRGVLFDTACGKGNLSLAVAKEAIAQGFLPDTISTDLNIYNWNHPFVYGLPAMMSKFIALGMRLEDVVDCVTENAAVQWGESDNMGCLCEGTCADITVLKLIERPMQYEDKFANTLKGDLALIPLLTVINGKVKYRSMELHP